jgi:hypothetical protein
LTQRRSRLRSRRSLVNEEDAVSENEMSEHYASIAYIARVRTADGRVIEADPAAAVAEARKFSKKFTPLDLEPKPPASLGR